MITLKFSHIFSFSYIRIKVIIYNKNIQNMYFKLFFPHGISVGSRNFVSFSEMYLWTVVAVGLVAVVVVCWAMM